MLFNMCLECVILQSTYMYYLILINQHLLSTYYVPGTVRARVNKTDTVHCTGEFLTSKRSQTTHPPTMYQVEVETDVRNCIKQLSGESDGVL